MLSKCYKYKQGLCIPAAGQHVNTVESERLHVSISAQGMAPSGVWQGEDSAWDQTLCSVGTNWRILLSMVPLLDPSRKDSVIHRCLQG